MAVAGLSRWLGGRERWVGGVCDLYIFGVFRAEQVSCVEAAHPKTRKKKYEKIKNKLIVLNMDSEKRKVKLFHKLYLGVQDVDSALLAITLLMSLQEKNR